MHRMHQRGEGGFTLIELMVVVLIIGILVAIALPTFLGARQRAENSAAQANLRNGMTAAKVFYSDRATYSGFDTAGQPEAIESSIDWVYPTAVASLGTVTIDLASGENVVLSSRSESGVFFCAGADAAGGGGVIHGNVDANGALVATDCTVTTGW